MYFTQTDNLSKCGVMKAEEATDVAVETQGFNVPPLFSQINSAQIGMARLSSPQLYWVLSGSDFTLDINNPEHPKIVCMGNNPEK